MCDSRARPTYLRVQTTPTTTTSFFSASKNYPEKGSPMRCWPANEWKSRSRLQPEPATQKAQHRRGESQVGRKTLQDGKTSIAAKESRISSSPCRYAIAFDIVTQ